MANQIRCLWSKGNLNPRTGTLEIPEKCKEMKCKMYFRSVKAMIEFCEVGQPERENKLIKKYKVG